MTGDNCAVVNCSTNRRTKGIGIQTASEKATSCMTKGMAQRDNKNKNNRRAL